MTYRLWPVLVSFVLLVMNISPVVGREGGESTSTTNTQLTVELLDGSRIIGPSVKLNTIPIKTDFGEIKVPLTLIQQFAFTKDRASIVLTFRNGDQLTGVLLLKQVKVKTAFGEATIPTERINMVGCKSGDSPTNTTSAKKWHDGISGTYKGVIGTDNDVIIFTFSNDSGALTASYTIDDPIFDSKPYNGKLMKFTETKGKERTLSCQYEDDINAGSYELTFSKDFKQLTGRYAIDNEATSDDNTVTATKQ